MQFQASDKEENAKMVHESVNHLDLSLGISSSNDACDYNKPRTGKRMISSEPETDDGFAAHKRRASVRSRLAFDYSCLFSHCPTGFVDPWSLAARQRKAVAEQAHLQANSHPSSSNIALLVGWPPIGTSRRNLPSLNLSRSFTHGEKDSTWKSENFVETKKAAITLELRPTLYVKVNMEGFFVGRKIDLSAHDSYKSLSLALQNMFHNFLSSNSIMKHGDADNSEFVLLYEDHEGDKILVGDVPWELFLTSVKRLYIARRSSAQKKASRSTKDNKKEEATT